MRVAIVGTGGVGGYFGGRLAQAGEDVWFVARGEHGRAIRGGGLKVKSINGDFIIHPAQVTGDPQEIGFVDAILVSVKSWQLQEAADSMGPMLGTETFVVPVQNGVDAPALLRQRLGSERVIGGLCRIVSFIDGPGRIRHAALAPYIAFGELDNHPSERVERLRQSFERASGVTVEVPHDIQAAMWRKFLLIVAWSGVGAVTRSPIGTIRSISQTRQLLRQVMDEVVDVARAHEILLPQEAVGETLAFIDRLSPDATASMQRDIVDNLPSELEAHNGAVVRLGEAAGVDTPLNRFIYHTLLPMELKARGS